MATVHQVEHDKTMVQRVAQIAGWAFIVVGVAGFFVTGVSMEDDPVLAPRLFGIFPLNVLHNVVHLLLGVWGVASASSWTASKSYCIGAGLIYLALALLGIFTPDMFGLVPIGGTDVWLHVFFAIPLLAAGLLARRPTVATVDDRVVVDDRVDRV